MRPGRPNGFGAGPLGAAVLGAALLLAAPSLAAPSLAEPSLAEPSLAEPSLAEPSLAEPSLASNVPDGIPAASPPVPSRGWLSIGLLTGSTQFDAGLADYQWDTSPTLGWGVRGLVGRGRWAAGLELWRAGTTQSIGDLGTAPEVHATSLELVAEARIVERWGTHLVMNGHGGRMRIGYQPDQIVIQPPGPVSPIEVDLAPVDAWIGGAGLSVRRPVRSDWRVGLGVDARVFAIDTAHRAGTSVVVARESFGDWSARCEIARVFGRQ